jgi:YspA, cpYpsA-related SLOG family
VVLKVLVTGSRDLTDHQLVYDALDELWVKNMPLIVIHGDAKGADSFADAWATYREHVTPVRVIADWSNDGFSAGPTRNDRMLALGPDVVLAFFKEGAKNSGTTHMVGISRAAGVHVITYTEPE